MIPITRPEMGEAEADAARRVVLSGWTTQGPEVAAFEREFGEQVRATFACAVSNCTTALHLALLAAGVRPGDEVITVSHSFVATANAIVHCGARPVFVDIEPDSFNIDPARVEQVIGARTRAILCVHQMGLPCDMARLVPLAARRGLPLIEDAACAAGSEILWNGHWEPIGRPHGDAACFSFHPRKVISTGDGGMVTTRHADWDQAFRLMRQHGMDVPDSVRHGSPQVIFESYPVLGFNYRMTDIQAAVGREQLKRLPAFVRRRRELAARYAELLAGLPLRLPQVPAWARPNWQSYCVLLPDGLDQRTLMQALLDDGVSTRRGIMCSHREAPHAGAQSAPLRASERAQDRGVLLPLYPGMTETEQAWVCDALRRACCSALAPAQPAVAA
jgi:dTDP-4-amino-4,6-dideoxygalactose transaminase